jgi:hypothetical protein
MAVRVAIVIVLMVAAAAAGIGVSFVCLLLWPSPRETPCVDIPAGTVVIAPAFWNLGKDPHTGAYLPGAANERIAEKLEACAGRFRLVLTQKAVSDALENEAMLHDGTPVAQMHQDNATTARTLEALVCAVDRLGDLSPTTPVGLIAHDKHLARSRQALRAVMRARFPGVTIVDIHLGKTPYQDNDTKRPRQWAARELLARPVQSLQILKGRVMGFDCSEEIGIAEKLTAD